MSGNELKPLLPETGDDNRLLVASLGALLLGIVHQYLFFDRPWGLSVFLFFALYFIYYFKLAGKRNKSAAPFVWVIFAGIGLLALTYALVDSPVFRVLNVSVLFVMWAFHGVMHAGQAGKAWYRKQMANKLVQHLFPRAFGNFPLPFRLLKTRLDGSLGRKRLLLAGKIGIGLLLALPLVFVVTVLLASADRAFEQLLSGVPEWLSEVSVHEWIFRGIWLFIVGMLLFGFVWGLVGCEEREQHKKTAGQGDDGQPGVADVPGLEPVFMPAKPKPFVFSIDPVIAHTVLFAVNAVYVLFVSVQFSYLFGAWDGVLPDGLTYAEHARSGFFELAFVAVINFVLLAIALTWSRPQRKIQHRLQRILLTVLMAGTLVMLVSAFVRLQLYEEAYGYTVLRFMVHAFLFYMAVMLVAALYRIWREGVSLVRLFVYISLAAWLAINYAGADRQVAERNIARHEAGAELDAAYLRNLSHDAVPALLSVSGHHPEVRQHLERQLEKLEKEKRPLLSWNLSRERALKLLQEQLR